MANFEIKFFDCADLNGYIKVKHENPDCDLTNQYHKNGIISITGLDPNQDGTGFCIWLDKSTAIKFAKTLRTEINKITESEVNNG
jgi:hypothetical protein